MCLPSINFLHLTVSEIEPGQDFQTQGHYGKVKGQIKVRPWRCTATPPNQCPYQVSTSYTLRFLRDSPDKLFPVARPPARTPAHPDTMGENNTPTAIKGCGVKMEALVKTKYRIFPKYGPGVNYFQMASDQALNWTRRSFEIQKTVL